jgi:hypothetical protein
VVMARRQCECGVIGVIDAWLGRQLEHLQTVLVVGCMVVWLASGQSGNTAMSGWRCSLSVLVETPLRGGGEARFA